MKRLSLIAAFTIFQIFALSSIGQNKIATQLKISKTNIVGLWQIDTPTIGAYIIENFQFFKDGKFTYNYDPSDDTRNIMALKGNYRLDEDDKGTNLFLTIKYRTVRSDGNIVTSGLGVDDYLFTFDNNVTKIISEKNYKELDPLYISEIKKTKSNVISIKINNRKYYKISSDPNKYDSSK